MQPERRPLLSITIPTYNRSVYLAELLECLLPQVAGDDRVELVLSDNASPDDTASMVEGFVRRGLACRYLRNAENIGPDGNFLQCLDQGRGKYVWVLGDDDLLAEGTLPRLLGILDREPDFDLIYLSSVGFSGQQRPQRTRDVFGRFAETVTDGDFFLAKVNSMITLISANIVNKDRLLATPHPPFEELNRSNLIQLGWLLPVLHRRCRVLYVWERVLYYRAFNSGGWGICEVFGLRLNAIATRYFAAEPTLARHLMNGVLSMWLPDHILMLRQGELGGMEQESFARKLRPIFVRSWRFWFFVYPVAAAPLSIAAPMHRVNRLLMKLLRGFRMLTHYLGHRGQLIDS